MAACPTLTAKGKPIRFDLPSLPSALRGAVEEALREGEHRRTTRLDVKGQYFWLKRVERPGLLRRLQKGDSAAAFERERQTLHRFGAMGLPVPEIIAEGPDWLLMPDSGTPLDRVLLHEAWTKCDRQEAFASAGEALALLHREGVSHGRPAIKDICWQGSRTTFIDFENHRPKLDTPDGHARDLLIFALSGLAIGNGPTPAMTEAFTSYRANDVQGNWERAQDRAARLGWADLITKPLQMRRPGKAREFKAIPHVLEVFSRK